MHIRPAEPGQSDGRQREPGTVRKVRLGGVASRVPVQTSKKTSETPLRALVSAIGQSLGSRTPLRGQTIGTRTPSSVKSSLFSGGGKPSSSTPADGTRSKSLFASEGRNNGTSSAAARSTAAANSSRVPSTPKSSRTQATAGTPSKVPATPLSSRARATAAAAATPSNRRSSLSSSSSYSSASSSNSTIKQSSSSSTPSSRLVPSTPSSRQVPSTPSSRQVPATPSTASRRKLDPSSTQVTKKSTMPPRTPKTQNNPNTPSRPSCIPLPTPRRPAVNSTPGASTPKTRSKSFFPTTPVSKHTSENPPTTPVSGIESNNNGYNTPYGQNGSNQTFYTPTTTLPITPLQPRNVNVPDSSRKLHFGINVAAMAEQENMGNITPRPAISVINEATFSFDKNRLAQIKARKNSSQLLQSPAQRIRAPDFHPSQTPSRTPGRVLQQVAEDCCTRFDDGAVVASLNHSPARRRVANALF